MIFFDLQCQ